MANLVEIKINVDNAQALQGVQQTTAAFQGMPGAVGKSASAMDGFGEASRRAGQSQRELGGHMASSLDVVRLASQEFGLRLPRALEAMISRSQMAMTALSGLTGAFAGIAAVEVGVRMAEGLSEAYTKFISLNAEADKFYETLQKTSREDFGNSRSIETTRARLSQAQGVSSAAPGIARTVQSGAFGSGDIQGLLAGLVTAHDIAGMGSASSADMVKLTGLNTDQEHQRNLQRIEDSHNVTVAMSAERQAAIERDKAHKLADENRTYDRKKDMELGNFVSPNAGAETQSDAYRKADQEYTAKMIANAKEVSEKTIALRNEATNAGLRGNALYEAQERQAEDAIRRNVNGTEAQIDAIRSKYHNEQMKRIEEESDAIAKREEGEKLAGLTGLAKLQEQGADRDREINQRFSRGGYADGANGRARDLALSAAQTYRERRDLDKQYQEQEAAENDRADADKVTGYARIEHELQASLERRAKAFADMYGQLDKQDAAFQAAQARLAEGTAHDSENADRQRADLAQQINDRTTAMDKQASDAERRVRGEGMDAWVRNYQDSVAAILSAHTEMNAKIDAEQRKMGGDPGQYQRQKVDADRVANAEIAEQNEQLKHQIAGTLEDAFTDPLRFIQNKFKEMLFNMAADAIMHSTVIKNAFGGIFPGMGGAGGSGTISQGGGLLASLGGGAAGASGSGTVGQMSAVPGYSGTAAGAGGSGMSLGSGISSLGSLAQTGSGTADALSAAGGTAPPFNSSGETLGAGYSYNGDDGGFGGDWINGSSAGNVAAAGGPAAAGAGLSTLGSVVGAGAGIYAGTTGIIGAYESGSASGILSGATSGAALGASIGMFAGPLGAGIGAGIGAIGGATAGLIGWATGEGGRIAGTKYYKDTVKPAMDDAERAYLNGGGDLNSGLSAVNQAAFQGFKYIGDKYGLGTADWVRNAYIKKEQDRLTGDMMKLAGSGRDYTSASAVQFHTGGLIRGFGSMGTGGDEGYIHAQMGEVVTSRADSLEHAPMLQAIGNGASPADVAGMYLQAAGSYGTRGGNSGGGDTHHHWDVQAMDAKSFKDMLVHGGGMDAISYAANKRVTNYAGDSY